MASDMISRSALYKKILHLYEVDKKATGANAYDLCGMLIEDAPTVDAVEVVRCRDCKFGQKPTVCLRLGTVVKPNDFCSRGVKKDAVD